MTDKPEAAEQGDSDIKYVLAASVPLPGCMIGPSEPCEAFTALQEEVKRLKDFARQYMPNPAPQVQHEPAVLDSLDWSRLMSGQRRALDPKHQPIFDKLVAQVQQEPVAYKDIDAVMEAQKDLVDIVHTLKQCVCVKG